MHGAKAIPIATIERSSRSRSSSRCEIRVPSASFSGSSLMGGRRWGLGGWRRLGGGRGRRLRRFLRRRAPRLLELHFLFQLLAELARHGSGPANPPAYLGHHTRKLLRSQHDQCQDEDDQDFGKTALEQVTRSDRSWAGRWRWAGYRSSSPPRRTRHPSQSASEASFARSRPRSWPS